ALEDSASQVEWQQADCTALPFPPASFSAVACQFGLMFPQDKHTALLEARRVLVDGGLLIFNVWDSLAHNPFIQVIQETIVSFFPTDPPRFFDRPYAFHDTRDWKDLLSASGFTDQRHEVVTLEARSPTAEQFAYGQICGSPLGQEIRERGGSMERILEAVTAALVRQGGEAPFTSSMQALVISARASASGHAADWVSDQV
ncbi:MAG: class I SAM-dependent methyltransferase, partial [Vicinamibacterales bacterium]